MFTKKVPVSIGGEWLIRGLKRREVKQLKAQGFDIKDREPDLEQVEKTAEAVLEMILPPDQFAQLDDLYDGEPMALYTEVIRLTYPSGAEAKN